MNGNSHFVFGVSLGTAIAMNMNVIGEVLPNLNASAETTTLFVLGGLIGGILPDIDNPTSYMGKLSAPVSTMFGTLGKMTGKTGSNHRGIMHDPTIYLIGLVLSYLYLPSLVGLFVGCLSHIFLDMFNPSGVPFLFGVKRLRLGKILSGSKTGVWFTWLNVFLVLIVGIVAKVFVFA